jgi:hypothetical protein
METLEDKLQFSSKTAEASLPKKESNND